MASPNWPVEIRSAIPGGVWWGELVNGKIKWSATTGYNLLKNLDAKYIGWASQMASPPTIPQNRYQWTANSKNEYYAWDGQTFGEVDAAMTAGAFSKHSLITSMVNDMLAGKIAPAVYAVIIWLAFYAPKTLLAYDSFKGVKAEDLIVPNQPISFVYGDAVQIPSDADKTVTISWMEDQPFPAGIASINWPNAGTVGTTGARTNAPANNNPVVTNGNHGTIDVPNPNDGNGIVPTGMSDTTKYVLIAGGVALTGTVLYFLLRKDR